jgi:hypothetical protein
VNALLRQVGLESLAFPWLGDPTTALWVVVLVSAWQWVGFPVLLYGAALGGVPPVVASLAGVDARAAWIVDRAAVHLADSLESALSSVPGACATAVGGLLRIPELSAA